MGIASYSTTAANNSAAPPNGWPEGMAPSALNDTGRQMMADIRGWYEAAEWIDFGLAHVYASGTQFTIGGGIDRTPAYHVGRRIRAQGAATGTIYGTIATAGYAAPTTTVTVVWDSGTMQNEALTIALHILSGNGTAMPALFARSGTKLLFPGISAAPAGWAIDTSGANEQATLRVRSVASNATGGSVDFATAFANGSTGSYTLALADIPGHTHAGPSHTHDLGNHTHGFSAVLNVPLGVNAAGGGAPAGAVTGASASTTGSPSTNITGASGTGNTGSAGGDGAHAHGLSLAVKYVDCCICVKI